MKGLLIKDARLIWKQKRFLVILLFLAIMLNFNSDGTFVIAYLTFIGFSFVLSTITYDETDNGYLFLMTLPVGRKMFAVEKYVFGLLLGSFTWTVGFFISIIFKLATEGKVSLFDFSVESLLLIPVFAVMLSILLPFQFKFGSEKGRIAMFLAFAVAVVAAYLSAKGLKSIGIDLEQILDTLPAVHVALVDLFAFLTAAAAVAVSCAVSGRIMQNKEF